MNKKTKIVVGCIVLLVVFYLVWWFMPIHFIHGVKPEGVASIQVFNDSRGIGFEITDPDDITYLVEQIQQPIFKKMKFSFFYTGTLYRITFLDTDGAEIDSLAVNSYRLIRKDPFFYECDESMGVVEYLENLENTQLFQKA